MDRVLKLVYLNWFDVTSNKFPFANGTSEEFISWAYDQSLDQEGNIPQFDSHYFYGENLFPNYYFRNSNFYLHCKEQGISCISLDEVTDHCCYFPVEIECNSICHILTDRFLANIEPALKYLQSGKVTLLLVNMVDPSLEPTIIKDIEQFFNNVGITKIALLQGNVRYDVLTDIEMHDSILSLYQTANEMDRYPYPTALGYISDYVRESDITDVVRPKKFISFNRFLDRPHRTGLAHLALKYNLLEQGYFSFLYNNKDDYADMLRVLELPTDNTDIIKSMVPYQIDTDHLPIEQLHTFFTVTNYKKELYLNSYVHVVTETQFEQNASPFLSEKTWRPILNLQPFIYMGNHLALNTLIKLGFKTFNPFIDERYDKEPNPVKRFRLIENEISKIAAMSIEEIHYWYMSILPILKHNQQTLYSYRDYNPIWRIQSTN